MRVDDMAAEGGAVCLPTRGRGAGFGLKTRN